MSNSILPTVGGKVLLYYRLRWVYYFSSLPGATVAIYFSAAGAKLLLCARSEENSILVGGAERLA